MSKMSKEEIDKHNENPNILLRIEGSIFVCKCGCNLFHNIDDNEVFICNSCKTEYDCTDSESE